ncbi:MULTISPECIES: uroporphyrinogen-III C-methyltransferase [Paracoccus]|uniref:uroporphyrinogen-III C-methyltransferase n=1 Tax=Paracoccus TaxID=265 RepID=UPI001FB5887C|nr:MULTISPECIES: uroporphyrinogen-III C-methyltransferase [Paracoccus]MCJ1898825.1 uroporphyrinogen-III C-methyltransferase [Paracoccus versutus]MDF3903231.1 uroporphyrinogen-III C-methyltransferase [Paracoccus sp. AS002]WGR61003.1 uroporphyrinogen-III C-methyltransferase [Paracoccus ferrooxidans]
MAGKTVTGGAAPGMAARNLNDAAAGKARMGRVDLIGAGPGDAELLTLRALRLLQQADVVVHDRLVSDEVMACIPAHVRRIPVGKAAGFHPVPQDEINALLVELALSGLAVARLKGGDPTIFGRGGEEFEAVTRAGIPCDYVPGITAAQGAAASARFPLTHRGLATGLRHVTGHRARDAALDLDWASLADPQTTLAVYMGAANMAEIAAQLIRHGMPADLPVLAVSQASTPQERRLRATLSGIAAALAREPLPAPVLFMVGHVAAMAEDCALPQGLYRPEWRLVAHG